MKKVVLADDYQIESAEVEGNSKFLKKVNLSSNYSIDHVEILKATREIHREQVRTIIVWFLFASVAIAMIILGFKWLINGDTSQISSVWSVGGPLVGMMVNHYFEGNKDE